MYASRPLLHVGIVDKGMYSALMTSSVKDRFFSLY